MLFETYDEGVEAVTEWSDVLGEEMAALGAFWKMVGQSPEWANLAAHDERELCEVGGRLTMRYLHLGVEICESSS